MSLMCHQFEIYVWCQMFSILVAWWTFIVLPVTSQGYHYHYYWVYKFWILHFDGDFWSYYSYCHQTFQVLLSIFMGPITLYLSLVYWMYPLNEFLGDIGCYAVIYGRNIWNFISQLHSFFMAIFRYTCLFHGNFLLRYKLTPNVNIINSSTGCIILNWSKLNGSEG